LLTVTITSSKAPANTRSRVSAWMSRFPGSWRILSPMVWPKQKEPNYFLDTEDMAQADPNRERRRSRRSSRNEGAARSIGQAGKESTEDAVASPKRSGIKATV
jgi:hypothetical protein